MQHGPQRWREYTIALAALSSVIWLCLNGLLPGSFLHFIVATRGDHSQVPLVAYADFMDGMLKKTSGGHSVLLRFSGSTGSGNGELEYIGTAERRGNYALCPNRCYCVTQVPPEIPLTKEWFTSHDVQAMIWTVCGADGRTWSRTWDIPPDTALPQFAPPQAAP